MNTDKYVCTHVRPNGHDKDANGNTIRRNAVLINSETIPGAPYFTMTWYCQTTDAHTGTHTHDFDEYIGFCGSDPDDPENLNGIVKFMIDGEWVVMEKSTILFIPAGVPHCPYTIDRCDKPIVHFSGAADAGSYIKSENK